MLFRCKTGDAYQIKVLAELLSNNLKNGCFDVTENGISLRMSDQLRKTLVDLDLDAENFSLYKFKSDEKLCLGLNLSHFHKMLKSVKKKDSLQLFINNDNPTELYIKTIPKENTRITTSSIKIQNIQNLVSDIPYGYGKPVIVTSSDFQKMCKELGSVGSDTICVDAKGFHIDFTADADGILKRQVRLGENDDSDSDSDEDTPDTYSATFSTDQFVRVSKISGLNTTMQIFAGSSDLPLLFRTNVGTLGKLAIYIKSKEMLVKELDESYSDSEYS